MSERKFTTMSGQPRDEENYGLREFVDDYGIMSNLQRWLHGHDEEIPAMPPGLGGLGFDVLDTSPNRKTMQDYIDEERKHFEEIRRKRRQFKDRTMNNLIDGDDIQSFNFEGAKKDTIATRTQPGDLVIPAEMMDINPELYQAFRAGLFMEGVDPDEFTAGHPSAKRNPITGEEHMFLDKIAKAVKKTVKKIASNPVGRTLINVGAATLSGGNPYVIGATNALTAKAAGASDTTAALSGLGAGFGAGLMNNTAAANAAPGANPGMLGKMVPSGTVSNALTTQSTGFGSGITNSLKNFGMQGLTSLAGTGSLGTTLANNVLNTSMASLAGAQLGGGLGSLAGMMIDPPKMPDMASFAQQNAVALPSVATGGTLPWNKAVNYAYAPQTQIPYAGAAGMFGMMGPSGPSYVSANMGRNGQMGFAGNMFGNRLAENSRRSGLGGFGQGILYY